MNRKLTVALIVGLVLTVAVVTTAISVSGAAFTTANPPVDGLLKTLCKNSLINCNIYYAKQYVWLNGGPSANGLGPDGSYFFAVLVPGGQPNPNDGGEKNLSDDYDSYVDRTFTVENGEVSAYSGAHDMDSGTPCTSGSGCRLPDGQPPLIRLYPYADTTNPGGVYIMAICNLDEGYPVDPRDCKYDAFKVKVGQISLGFMLSGVKFEDMDGDGSSWEEDDPYLEGWEITIEGTGFLGASDTISKTVTTGPDGAWNFEVSYKNIPQSTPVVAAQLTVCEVLKDGWKQSYPNPSCYTIEIQPAAAAVVPNLDFGNFQNATKSGLKFEDMAADGQHDADDPALKDWTINISGLDGMGNTVSISTTTASDGAYSLSVPPGTYIVCEIQQEDWTQSYPNATYYPEGADLADCSPFTNNGYAVTLLSGETDSGNDFGNWTPGEITGLKFKDRDWSGSWEEGEPGLPDVQINLLDGLLNEIDSTYTCGGEQVDCGEEPIGTFWFTGLMPGTYYVEEVVPDGYAATTETTYGPVTLTSGEVVQLGWVFGNAPMEGCTPGYWKQEQHFDSWVGYSPMDSLAGVFTGVSDPFYAETLAKLENNETVLMGDASLLDALMFTGGDTVPEKAQILLRAAVAAVLNTANGTVHYQYDSVDEIIGAVNDALATYDPDEILSLANMLDGYNNALGGCPLN